MPSITLALLAAILVFFLGNLYRVVKVMLMPAHLRWISIPFPKVRAKGRPTAAPISRRPSGGRSPSKPATAEK